MASLLFLPKTCPLLGESFCTRLPGDLEDQSKCPIFRVEWITPSSDFPWNLVHTGCYLSYILGLLRGFVFSHSHWKFPYRRVRSAPEIVIKTEAPLKIFASRHRLRDWTYGCRVGWGKGTVRKFGMVMYTLLCSKWPTNKDILSSTGNSAQCYVAAWMGREFGEWIHVYVWLSPFCILGNYLKLPHHC